MDFFNILKAKAMESKYTDVINEFAKSTFDSASKILTEQADFVSSKFREGMAKLNQEFKPLEDLQQSKESFDNSYLPWMQYEGNTNILRELILNLIEDSSTFTSTAPESFKFEFDSDTAKTAQALLNYNDVLQTRRYELVPKDISENEFWRNFFYRISLAKRCGTTYSTDTNHSVSDDLNTDDSWDKLNSDEFDEMDIEEELLFAKNCNLDEPPSTSRYRYYSSKTWRIGVVVMVDVAVVVVDAQVVAVWLVQEFCTTLGSSGITTFVDLIEIAYVPKPTSTTTRIRLELDT
ncbi:hypothetical protein GJ496_011802 [Pomphorhynchus laevis]|nr:hypothetical protein GJ496_011802 [Pomphorhynchus laevis]